MEGLQELSLGLLEVQVLHQVLRNKRSRKQLEDLLMGLREQVGHFLELHRLLEVLLLQVD